jgi:arylsulfatase A-like enzyme
LNVVLLFGEDVGRHHGCYGDPFACTPNIDRLAREGCRFTNGFSTAPVSAPSRSAMVTGQHANKLGSHHMRSHLLQPPQLFTEALRDAGVYVNWANKTDFNFEPPASFADATSDWIASLAAGELPTDPFLLYFNFGGTHEFTMWPPGGRESAGSEPPAPETGEDPARFDGLPIPPYLPASDTTRSALVRYYDSLAEQDAAVGRVLDLLDATGLAETTMVIYMSDHGRGLPREKRWTYDAGIHLPLVIRAPTGMDASDLLGVRPGETRNDLVSWVDLAPTLLALAGAAPSLDHEGRVFLGPDTEPEPPCVFAARDRMDECFDRVRVARDRRYLYLRNDFPEIPWAQRLRTMDNGPVLREMRERHATGDLPAPADLFLRHPKPPEELYDTDSDPHCLQNLADDPALGDTLQRLRHATAEWMARIDDQGMRTERELVESGLVADDLTSYAERYGHLPDHLRGGGIYDTHLEEPGRAL